MAVASRTDLVTTVGGVESNLFDFFFYVCSSMHIQTSILLLLLSFVNTIYHISSEFWFYTINLFNLSWILFSYLSTPCFHQSFNLLKPALSM